jgi:membrane-associated phospholipid phosphatase
MKVSFFTFALFLVLCRYQCNPAEAGENLFNSGTAVKQEFSRLSEEGKLFVKAPAENYLLETAAVGGAFALTYLFDRDIRSDLRGSHNSTLNTLADAGSAAGNPLLHVGLAAALYTSGVVADSDRLTRFGAEVGEALILSDGATLLLREAIGRRRPQSGNNKNSTFRPFQFKNDYDSLPSMHTASSFALAHVISSKTDNVAVKTLCYAAAAFVGFSRLYKDEHWASDIVLAAAIGELAGNSVTRYYALHESGLTIAPVSIGGVPSVALSGRF